MPGPKHSMSRPADKEEGGGERGRGRDRLVRRGMVGWGVQKWMRRGRWMSNGWRRRGWVDGICEVGIVLGGKDGMRWSR